MPKVGSKHFSYDKSGYDKAMQESERTGQGYRKARNKKMPKGKK